METIFIWFVAGPEFSTARNYKPFVSNGVSSAFCHTFVDVPDLCPTVAEAFHSEEDGANSRLSRGRSMKSESPGRSPRSDRPEPWLI